MPLVLGRYWGAADQMAENFFTLFSVSLIPLLQPFEPIISAHFNGYWPLVRMKIAYSRILSA